MNRRSFLVGAGAATFLASGALAETSSLAISAELDELIGTAMARLAAAAGLSVAVWSPDGAYTRGFGVTDVVTGERADADTAFYIASSTKPLTALALNVMARRGEIDLDMALAAFAPDAPWPASVRADRATFRHLLTHTSGIANDPIVFRLAYSGQHDPDILWLLLSAASANADAPLGTFEYTNAGYNIATLLTDRRFGMNWQDLLDREIFRPAGMRHATARMSRALAGGWAVARPHIALPEGITRIYLEKTDRTMQSAGGIVMSANAAVRWLELMINAGAVDGRQIIDQQAVMETRLPVATLSSEFAGYTREAYGLGWYHVPFRGERMLHHFGGFAGARAHVSYIPARRIGVAAFVNDSSAATQLTDAVADYVYDRTAGRSDALATFDARIDALVARRDQHFERVTADRAGRAGRASTLTRPAGVYAGSYENAQFGRIHLTMEGQDLNVTFGVMHSVSKPAAQPDAIRVELLPYSGEVIAFDGPANAPSALSYDGQTYARL